MPSLTLEEINALIAALGVVIPAEYLRQKEQEALFTRRCAAITAEFPSFKEHHSGQRAEELLNTAGMLAGRERDYDRALATLDELETLLRSPVPAAPAPVEPESSDEPQESEKLDSIAKGKRRADDKEAAAREWEVLAEAMQNLEGWFQKAIAARNSGNRQRTELEKEHARLSSVVKARSGKTDTTASEIKSLKAAIETVLTGPLIEDEQPSADPEETKRLDSIAKGKRRADDNEAEAKEWEVLQAAMRNLESWFQKAIAKLDPSSRRRAELEKEYARLSSVVGTRSGETDATSEQIKSLKALTEGILTGTLPPDEPKAEGSDLTDQIKLARRRGVELQESIRSAFVKLVELQGRFGDTQEKKKEKNVTPEAIGAAKTEMGKLLEEIGTILSAQAASLDQLAKYKDGVDKIRVGDEPSVAAISKLHQTTAVELSDRLKSSDAVYKKCRVMKEKMAAALANDKDFLVADGGLTEYEPDALEIPAMLFDLCARIEKTTKQFTQAGGDIQNMITEAKGILSTASSRIALKDAQAKRVNELETDAPVFARNFGKWNAGVIKDWKALNRHIASLKLGERPDIREQLRQANQKYDAYALAYGEADERQKDLGQLLAQIKQFTDPQFSFKAGDVEIRQLTSSVESLRTKAGDPIGRLERFQQFVTKSRKQADEFQGDDLAALDEIVTRVNQTLEEIKAQSNALKRAELELQHLQKLAVIRAGGSKPNKGLKGLKTDFDRKALTLQKELTAAQGGYAKVESSFIDLQSLLNSKRKDLKPAPADSDDPNVELRIFAEQAAALEKLQPRIQAALKEAAVGPNVQKAQAEAQRSIASRTSTRKSAAALRKLELALDSALGDSDRHSQLENLLGPVKKSYLPTGMADQLAKGKLDPGKEFKAFLAALKQAESKKTKTNLDAVESAAKVYLDHVQEELRRKFKGDMAAMYKKEPERKRKTEICESALKAIRHWRLADEREAIGPPPWDTEKQLRAGALYSKVLLEQDDEDFTGEKRQGAPPKMQPKMATMNDPSKGVSGAWWIEKTVYGETKHKNDNQGKDVEVQKHAKKFIFKPALAEGKITGYPHGGSAPREMLGGVMHKQIMAMSGLDLGVPETHMVSLDPSKLPGIGERMNALEEEGLIKKGASPKQLAGSLQHFSKNRGEIGEIANKDPDIWKKIPKEECHKVALMDLLSLNLDRHGGNALVGEKLDEAGNAVPSLLPIDHGLILPPPETLMARKVKMGKSHNALLDMPVSNEKFSPEMQESIDKIDPQELVRKMNDAVEAMKKQNPEMDIDSVLDRKSFNLVIRSAEFLKKAAKELSVAELFNAYQVSAEEIFFPADGETADQKDAKLNQVIAGAKQRGAALREAAAIPNEELKRMAQIIGDLGWAMEAMAGMNKGIKLTQWIELHPAEALKIYKGRIKNPAVVQEVANLSKDLDPKTVAQIASLPVGRAYQKLLELRDERSRAQATAMGGGKSPTLEKGVLATAHARLGGDAKLAASGLKPDQMKYTDKQKTVYEMILKETGGEPEAANLRKAFSEAEDSFKKKDYARMVTQMEQWSEYQKLGGDPLYFKLGGNSDLPVLDGRLARLKEMLREEQDFKTVTAISPEKAAAMERSAIEQELQALRQKTEGIREPTVRAPLKARLDAATALANDGKIAEYRRALIPIEPDLDKAAIQQQARLNNINRTGEDIPKKLELVLALRDSEARRRVQALHSTWKDSLSDWLNQGKFDEAEKAQRQLLAEMDRALLGDEAPVAQFQKRFEAAVAKAKGKKNIEENPKYQSDYNAAKTALDAYALEGVDGLLTALEKDVSASK